MMDSKQLIKACKKQDREAQRAIYELYAPLMMAVCLRYCGDKELAKDLLHDGFIVVFNKIESYSFKGSFEGWMRRIFVNLAIADYRKKRNKYQVISDVKYLQESDTLEVEHDEDEEVLDISSIPQEEVLEMIRDLPIGYRTVFNLYVFEELSHKEIAERLQINESSSRSQFFRARKILQKKILSRLRLMQEKRDSAGEVVLSVKRERY